MATTPAWQAARNGMPGDLDATNAAAQVNQMLGTHGITGVYESNAIVSADAQSSTTWNDFFWLNHPLTTTDADWPFTLPIGQTAIGRIRLPLKPVGEGADLQVSLCADNAGGPGTVLASTVAPKKWLTSLGAPNGLAAAGPLATASSNILQASGFNTVWWGNAATSATGYLSTTTVASYGSYMLMIGGEDSTSGSTVPYVYSVPLSAQGAGAVTPQPSLPQAMVWPGAAATQDTVVVVGGYSGSAVLSNVYTATWNPNTGTISTWTNQASLPTPLRSPAVAVYNDSTIYAIGGWNGSTPVNTVYYASITNGQIQTWQTGPALPTALYGSIIGIFGNFLLVVGGLTGATTASSSAVYYAQINSDGSLGGWQTGPSLPVGVGSGSGNDYLATDSGLYIMGGITTNGSPPTFASTLQSLTVTSDGLGQWQQHSTGSTTENMPAGGFSNGDGTYTLVSISAVGGNSYSNTATITTVPFISVPLVASGLTGGGTYHILVHQVGGDANNNVQLGAIQSSSQKLLLSTRYSGGPWTTYSGFAVLARVFDQSQTGSLLHTWEDPSGGMAARTSTFVNDHRGRLLGVCEATTLPNNPLDSNPTFTTGVSPWTAVGGTITQSNAQTHGGYPYSGLLTPDGVSATAYARSEHITIQPGTWYTAQGWVYTPTGWSTVSLSIIWYDQQGNVVSTYNNNLAVTASTWTQLTNTVQAPATAAQAALAPAEGGTPATTNTLYLSYVTLTEADPSTLSSVAQVTYSGVWPPTGITQLA